MAWLGLANLKPEAKASSSQLSGLAWLRETMAWLAWLLASSQSQHITSWHDFLPLHRPLDAAGHRSEAKDIGPSRTRRGRGCPVYGGILSWSSTDQPELAVLYVVLALTSCQCVLPRPLHHTHLRRTFAFSASATHGMLTLDAPYIWQGYLDRHGGEVGKRGGDHCYAALERYVSKDFIPLHNSSVGLRGSCQSQGTAACKCVSVTTIVFLCTIP
ncbi:hypothetical protein B0H11DRAFT_2345627 [Mycena galericulata]|nr:hypothetical protein B0H11DRAFT_2345627 [Mycena galericulata]